MATTAKRRPTTGYRAIADYYAQRIAEGELAPGDHLPTMRTAKTEWQVSHMTIVRAYQLLRQRGLTVATSGAGTMVAPRASADMASRIAQHASTGSALPPGETSEIMAVEMVSAPDAITSRLGVSPGESVLMRRRRVSARGTVMHVSTSYYPQRVVDAAPELAQPTSTGGSRELAADRLGARQAHVLEEVYPIRAEPADAQALGATVGDPLIHVTRTVWLSDDSIVEVATKITHQSLRWATRLD